MLLNTRRPIGTIAHLMLGLRGAEEFHWSWAQMVQYNAEYLCGPTEMVVYQRAMVSDHAFARNALVAGMKGDWLLMLDTDHEFDPDLAARMLRTMDQHQIDVLTGLYVYGGHPHAPVLYAHNSDGAMSVIVEWDPAVDLFQVGAAGAGCLLVRRSVFDRIRVELDEQPFTHRGLYSEDHSFFDRLRDLKIPAFCCPRIESAHVRTKAYTSKDRSTVGLSVGPRMDTEGRTMTLQETA